MLTDREAKEHGYRRALENLVVDGLLSLENEGADLDSVIRQITQLTDQRFTDRDRWIDWWNENHERLALSDDGTHLVVRD